MEADKKTHTNGISLPMPTLKILEDEEDTIRDVKTIVRTLRLSSLVQTFIIKTLVNLTFAV